MLIQKKEEGALEFANLILLPNRSRGTGFRIYNEKREIFLVTAKHVLFNDSESLHCNAIDILCRTLSPTGGEDHRISIDLVKCKPKPHVSADVAVVKIGELIPAEEIDKSGETDRVEYLDGIEVLIQGEGDFIIGSRRAIKGIDDVVISKDIFLVGFPSSLGLEDSPQFDYGLPLLRKGIVANIYRKQSTIILDCPVFPGNSGSPVLQFNEANKINLIGVVSQYIPYVQKWASLRDPKLINSEHLNSGYSVAVSMDKVFELID